MAAKIMAVDDDQTTLRILEQSLSAEGFQTILLPRGQDALRIAKDELPDLILMDLILPDMEGSYIIRALRENPSTVNIPVIVISSIAPEDAEPGDEGSVNVGGVFYRALSKPFSHEDLIGAIQQALFNNKN